MAPQTFAHTYTVSCKNLKSKSMFPQKMCIIKPLSTFMIIHPSEAPTSRYPIVIAIEEKLTRNS